MTGWSDTIEVAEAETRLRELLEAIKGGAEITLVEGEEVVARLLPPLPANTRIPGLHAGMMMPAEDFDAPLDDAFWNFDK